MRVFVAGATGVLGRPLLLRLLEDRYAVRAIVPRPSRAPTPPGVESVDADLLVDDLCELVRGCDAVVHVVSDGLNRPPRERCDLYERLLTVGTRRLLDAAITCRVPRYVQQSFAVAYRDGGDRWLDEDAPFDDSARRARLCRPVIEMETSIRQIDAHALGWTILRGGSFVGPGTLQDALIDRLRARGAVVAGDGANYLSPLNVVDMASAVATAVVRAPTGSTFNIVDEPLRYADYVDALADLIGVERPQRIPRRPLPESRRCSNAAARTILGWMPRHSIWPSPTTARGPTRLPAPGAP